MIEVFWGDSFSVIRDREETMFPVSAYPDRNFWRMVGSVVFQCVRNEILQELNDLD
jgi:hypothetical protein